MGVFHDDDDRFPSSIPSGCLAIELNDILFVFFWVFFLVLLAAFLQRILHQYPLHRISYCADDKAEKKFFSFIAKEPDSEKHTCYVFVSDKLVSGRSLPSLHNDDDDDDVFRMRDETTEKKTRDNFGRKGTAKGHSFFKNKQFISFGFRNESSEWDGRSTSPHGKVNGLMAKLWQLFRFLFRFARGRQKQREEEELRNSQRMQ